MIFLDKNRKSSDKNIDFLWLVDNVHPVDVAI